MPVMLPVKALSMNMVMWLSFSKIENDNKKKISFQEKVFQVIQLFILLVNFLLEIYLQLSL